MIATGDGLRVLGALKLSADRRSDQPLPLRRIATRALEGDTEKAVKILAELDAKGYVRTNTMGWYTGWLTPPGRAAAESLMREGS